MSDALDRAVDVYHAERKAGLGEFGAVLVACFAFESENAEPGSVEEKIGVWADVGREALEGDQGSQDDADAAHAACHPRPCGPYDPCPAHAAMEEERPPDDCRCGPRTQEPCDVCAEEDQ